jgi:hypothetical protein
MNEKNELYWGDKERIRRAEEIRKKYEKKGGEIKNAWRRQNRSFWSWTYDR